MLMPTVSDCLPSGFSYDWPNALAVWLKPALARTLAVN
jgi:hypothetical protein